MENDKVEVPKQFCTITVVFPVLSDGEAITVKKKIDDAVSEVMDSLVDFRIRGIPKHGPPV